MGLSDIAAGIETTTEQRDRGVAAVDGTDRPLRERLDPFAGDLPCTAAAATVVGAYAGGASVGESAREAAVAPVTAAKTLHLLGVEGVTPLSPTGRRIVRDWLTADVSRADALTLTGASEAEFALAAFVETHDPLPGAREVVEEPLAGGVEAGPRDCLADALGDDASP
jgi:hypothetical protein